MDDCASQKALVPVCSQEASLLQRLGAPENITAMVDLYALLAEKMRKQELNYLSLPPVLAGLEDDLLYQQALCWGRGFYFDDLHDVDESGHLVRMPYPFSRPEILHYVQTTLCLNEPRVAVLVPLAWRVGLVVGWLSGLSISQAEDAQAGMVVLASLVSPLVSGRSDDKVQRAVGVARRLRPGRK